MSSDRYLRQELLIGEEGQTKLGGARVAVVGAGALGSVVSELLVRSGIGSVLIVDRDLVEESNLQRQLLYCEEDVGKSKALAAKERLVRVNSLVKIEAEVVDLDASNVSLLSGFDLVFDCTDNMQTRFLLNDYCHKIMISWIYGAAVKSQGSVMVISDSSACFSCFMNEKQGETCDTVGVLNSITTVVAGMQVSLGLKVLLGENVESHLHSFDIGGMSFRKVEVVRREGCLSCSGKYEYLQRQDEIVRFCSTGKYQIKGVQKDFISLKKKWEKLGGVIGDGVTLKFGKIVIFKDGRALIEADSKEEARSIYSRFVGD